MIVHRREPASHLAWWRERAERLRRAASSTLAELPALRGQQAQVERLICRTPPQTRDGALVVAATLLETWAVADDFPDGPAGRADLAPATFILEHASVAQRERVLGGRHTQQRQPGRDTSSSYCHRR